MVVDASSNGETKSSEVPITATYIPRDVEYLCEAMALEWVADKEDEETTADLLDAPPVFLIDYPDLFERGWGWERLFPYHSSSVEWPQFKKYLEEYSSHNAGQVATLCSQLRSVQGQGIPPAGCGVLHDAANLCIKIENKLLRSCHSALTVEEIILSSKIKECASHMIQSEGESSAAAAGLVGIAKEARKLSYLLSEDDPDMCLKYDMCEYIRAYAAEVLTKLEKEFSCNTAGHAAENGITASDKSEKPIGNVKWNSNMKKLKKARKKRLKRAEKRRLKREKKRLKREEKRKSEDQTEG
ncbi:hypothetical protein OsJ_33346 [Oryza sativa Japonica Group]|uniref:Uncharacterized protein n=1 Tax=Oryza sativa subsp. japonica TaxID=39947 RepID=B9G9Y9_ORYSJ|nr:hypothetical protein OsJ_33346 [Oryza sativa Japonica Group]